VLVTDVHEVGSSHGQLLKGDVILSVDGHPVGCNGRVDLEGQSVEMTEIVERKFAGDSIRLGILRKGQPLEVTFPLTGSWPFRMQSTAYDTKPRYLIHGGLLFQPLDRNLIEVLGNADLGIRRHFDEFVDRHLYLDLPEVVVLSRVLDDPVNKDCDGLRPGVVDTVNGRKIRSLGDLAEALALPCRHDVIILRGEGVPIVLDKQKVSEATPGILRTYRIPSDRNL
jgi:hypothetical protein